jgi:hypothetical protein
MNAVATGPARVVLACSCGARLELPPRAAEAARKPWNALHQGPGHAPTDPAAPPPVTTFEQFIAVAGKTGR